MNCRRCGAYTPRFTVTQRYCPPCEGEVAAIVALDERRRRPRFPARDETGGIYGRAA